LGGAVMDGMDVLDSLWGWSGWIQRLSVTFILMWCASRFLLGVSLFYLLRTIFREMTLRFAIWRGVTMTPLPEGDMLSAPIKGERPPLHGIRTVPPEATTACGQTIPPTKKVAPLFASFDVVEHHNYGKRTSDSVQDEESKEWKARLYDARHAAEVHRQVRHHVQRTVRPGMRFIDICENLEATTHKLIGFNAKNPTKATWGFPTGVSVNNCAAHWTPNPGDDRVLQVNDVVKIDFGTAVNGHIMDSAFSMSFTHHHDGLMKAVEEATAAGVREAGVDVRCAEIGGTVREVMESFEVEYNGKTFPVKSIVNLSGHLIKPYHIHGGKNVPIHNTGSSDKMMEGEMYAIETFGSTGYGYVMNQGECSHFMRASVSDWQLNALPKDSKKLLSFIDSRFDTLPFCGRWLHSGGFPRWQEQIKALCNMGVVRMYPPLCDIQGCYTAQYEHTILLKPSGKEVLTRGPDY